MRIYSLERENNYVEKGDEGVSETTICDLLIVTTSPALLNRAYLTSLTGDPLSTWDSVVFVLTVWNEDGRALEEHEFDGKEIITSKIIELIKEE